MSKLLKSYRDLETRVFNILREKIGESTEILENYGRNVFRINIEKYVGVIILNNSLTLVDADGYQYSIFAVGLEDLINEID